MPYDSNRVVLTNPIEGTNYINASWVKNDSLTSITPTFIASQGPFEHTIPHFLQMIVENKVRAVVMLTKIKETQKDGTGNLNFAFAIFIHL